MSGLEVAGVVLGALPILFKALDLYKDGINRVKIAFRKRKYVDKLAHAVLFQKQNLEEIVWSVVHASGCEDCWRLADDPVGYLNNATVQEQILDYLGPNNDVAFKWALEKSYDAVREIARNMAGLVPAAKDHTDELLGIIRANQLAGDGELDLVPRVKLLFGVKELKSAVRELDDTTNALERFARVISSNRPPIESTSSGKAIKLAKTLRQVRGFASSLYLAILRNWTARCHIKHEAKLFLEDRIDINILKQARKDSSTPILVFRLIFAASTHQGHTLRHETEVQVLKDDADESSEPLPSGRPSRPSRVTIVAPQTTSQAKPQVTSVSNICGAIEVATCDKRHVAFVLTGNQQQMGMISSDKNMFFPWHQADTMTLKELLLSTGRSPNNNSVFPLKDQMLLALRLASNLLQLLQTQWLQSTWSSDVVHFLFRPTDQAKDAVGDDIQVEFGRPFVSLTFEDTSTCGKTEGKVAPRVALLELGILLLEIWHQKTLETQFSLKEPPTEFYNRLNLASKWLDDLNNPLPVLYDKAVSHCVRGVVGGESRLLEWDDMVFWGALCADIIEPLSKICKQWRCVHDALPFPHPKAE